MEYGFYHPASGYWQAISGSATELLRGYPEGTSEVPLKPGPDYEWQNGEWKHEPLPPIIPSRVTARQFKMQLHIAGLLSTVEAWVGAQEQLVQIAYQNSGTFVRTEPMMQTGFAALGFTQQQIEDFYSAAAAL